MFGQQCRREETHHAGLLQGGEGGVGEGHGGEGVAGCVDDVVDRADALE